MRSIEKLKKHLVKESSFFSFFFWSSKKRIKSIICHFFTEFAEKGDHRVGC
jgi:hypothetical protein